MKSYFIATLILLSCFSCVQRDLAEQEMSQEEKYIHYYSEITRILTSNRDDPRKAEQELIQFREANLADLKKTADYVHNLPDDKMAKFVKDYEQDIQSIIEQLFSLFGTKVGDDAGVNEVLESFPEMELQKFDKFWPDE